MANKPYFDKYANMLIEDRSNGIIIESNDYDDLDGRPKINGITLSGNNTSSALGLQNEIPVIDITASKLISESPIKVQFTAQDDLLINTADNPVLILDATPVDLGVITVSKSSAYDSNSWLLSQIDGNENISTGRISDIKAEVIIYDPTTKIGTYESINLLQERNIINTLNSTDTTKPLSANAGKTLNDTKQNITDNLLTTTNKTITSAINEVNSIAKEAQQAISFETYKKMTEHFTDAPEGKYNEGQNVMIATLGVSDLWVSGVESEYLPYIYVDDETITTTLESVGYIQVGYYKLSQLKAGTADLTNYVKKTEINTEQFVFTMADGTQITKNIKVSA